MPYIKQEQRKKFNAGLWSIDVEGINSAGELNYIISWLLAHYKAQNNESYQTYNDMIGVLECAKLELYRRYIGNYEDKKISENGDI